MKRSRMRALRAILVLLTLLVGLPALLTRPSQATTTLFDNFTGSVCDCGFVGPGWVASGFMLPFGSLDSFAGAAAFVQQQFLSEKTPQPFSMALYSSTSAGAPSSSPLWTSETLFTPGLPNSSALVGETYGGPSILLLGGTEYFLALNLSPTVGWLQQGPTPTPVYLSEDGNTWTRSEVTSAQFQIFGDIATGVVPEPSTWAMMLIGFAGLGYAAVRKAPCARSRRKRPFGGRSAARADLRPQAP